MDVYITAPSEKPVQTTARATARAQTSAGLPAVTAEDRTSRDREVTAPIFRPEIPVEVSPVEARVSDHF